ncbi:hypothetical protein F5Y14DRAFT_23134 [Nemania sp. NC0429]|nr:hypothetical protein F5Y14DRAFT_23134 [Nemania sp. NC0429]
MPPDLVPTIPKTHQVIPGARVNIVLKADQRTGRQVQGTVQNVLTRGDHHRGIKVRLTDGRIGRVQSMASSPVGNDSSTQPSSTGSSGPSPLTLPTAEDAREPRGQGRRPRYRDVRLEEPLDVPSEQTDLSVYIVPSKRKGRGKKRPNDDTANDMVDPGEGSNSNGHGTTTTEVIANLATCPVCGMFEGDETAVAHHVAEHFGS